MSDTAIGIYRDSMHVHTISKVGAYFVTRSSGGTTCALLAYWIFIGHDRDEFVAQVDLCFKYNVQLHSSHTD